MLSTGDFPPASPSSGAQNDGHIGARAVVGGDVCLPKDSPTRIAASPAASPPSDSRPARSHDTSLCPSTIAASFPAAAGSFSEAAIDQDPNQTQQQQPQASAPLLSDYLGTDAPQEDKVVLSVYIHGNKYVEIGEG